MEMIVEEYLGIIIREKNATHTSITRNWYPKPIPPDIQFEERELRIRAAYTADALYEWNIDDLSEYKILNVLYEMMMIANVYKNTKRSDHQLVNSLITDFKDVFLSRLLIRMDNRASY
jgi:hypothetical protein